MIQISSLQLEAWVAMLAFPVARVLGVVMTAPVFGNRGMPMRIRLMIGLGIALGLAPALPPMPTVPLGSWTGLLMMVQESLIGLVMGFTLRLAFTALDIAGELLSLQMGLSFATFFDPMTNAQTGVVGEILALLTSLVFLSLNGHLLVAEALVRSFEWLPVRTTPINARGWGTLVQAGAMMFGSALMLALPAAAALLITNLALAVLTRAAPQLNLFAIGFPITLTVGIGVIGIGLEHMAPLLQHLYEEGFELMARVARSFG
jgi:flagellar biosynthetic protein FliR